MFIFGILILEKELPLNNLPIMVQRNIQSISNVFPENQYYLFQRDVLYESIKTSFGHDIFSLLQKLKPFSYQCDFSRYLISYLKGGVYADLSINLHQNFVTNTSIPTVFLDLGVASYWDIYSGLYFFPSKHKALERVIDLVSHNIRRKHFGHNPLCPTGPYVLGKAIAQTCEADEIFVGRSEIIERPFLNPNDLRFWHCLLAGNKVIAEKRKGRTGLAEYGINEGNNYQDLWKNNDIYI